MAPPAAPAPPVHVRSVPATPEPPPYSGEPYGSLDGSASGKTVLLVDDDFRNIFALTALLEREHLNVIPAESGIEALEILDSRSDIHLALMDIMMPVMDGYETMTAIRNLPQWADLPIIAVTGKVIGGERERCLAAGASDYIPKPVDAAELLAALSPWFPAAEDDDDDPEPSGEPVVAGPSVT